MMLYEPDACATSQIGQVTKDEEGIRQIMQRFVDMRGKLESKVKMIIQTSDLALANN